MLIKKTHLALLLSIALVCACGSTEKDNEQETANIDAFRTYPVDITISETSVLNHIESVEVLGLEETEASLLDNASYVHILKDHIVFRNGYRPEVFIYSKTGNFLAKIDRKGEGPEEYTSIREHWVNENLIQIYDGRRIVSYDMGGEFVKSLTVKNSAAHLNSLEGGYVADVSSAPVEGTLKYNIAFLNEKLERDTLAVPYTTAKKTGMFWLASTFSKYNDDLLYQHTYGDTIFKLKSKKAIPLLSVDLGDKWVWKDPTINQDIQRQKALRKETGAITMIFMLVSEELVYLDLIRAGKFLLNRQSGDYQKLSFNK